ncbi:MAG: AraC family transcriptional regulator ligand-binding domain-containing protein [Halioglobus sp.]|jgi:AraC-like DNA-binding protein|tara:strand:- start:4423 stop:5424 length:1002 start_codon:yes stop_codon:yes gene_type:complete
MNYLVNTNILSGFDALVSELGGSSDQILAQLNIPTDVLEQQNSFIPFRQAVALLEYTADTLHRPDFGIRLSMRQNLSTLGSLAVLVRNTRTIEDAFRAIARYMHLITPAITLSVQPNPSGQFIRLGIAIIEPGIVASRQILELVMGIGQSITHLLSGSQVYPQAIHFPHPRLVAEDIYRNRFHCPVYFEQPICAVDLPIPAMQRNVAGADEQTARLASEYLAMQYGRAPRQLADQISHLIRQLLPTGHCNIRFIAEQLHLHPRTLQRQLAAHGHVFEKLLDDERRALARHYLSVPDLRLTQIAGMLGYSDQSALNRSCRRWFDKTPKELRKRA